eukprot:SAG31_NODE_3400_length_4314_cov_2.906762_3_plen_213_part_00
MVQRCRGRGQRRERCGPRALPKGPAGGAPRALPEGPAGGRPAAAEEASEVAEGRHLEEARLQPWRGREHQGDGRASGATACGGADQPQRRRPNVLVGKLSMIRFLRLRNRQAYAQTANHSEDFRCSNAVFESGEDAVSAAMRKVINRSRFPIFLAVRLVSLAQVCTTPSTAMTCHQRLAQSSVLQATNRRQPKMPCAVVSANSALCFARRAL